ncbi:PEP/pyruvate-binding domain-containing protein [Desulfurivibrio dismutans]|uniref:PEP/pyruvate-binding domain-containing protein n=1 Tax=Desulfurivibrio dismutans TaxID=1398908 RepID=UPI0023DB4D8F|nr:PEP/pyruvate-binding domain-containing protein [Desulfurivibrio alkaliphilus]MDF1613903.1 PEP/pyruvate-binding domain-containing protein [Desulfurivibrio alkaliphilus]
MTVSDNSDEKDLICKPGFESDALRANLQETAVECVELDPDWQVLLEVVAGYQGIRGPLEELLYEISHPYRNWRLILPRLRSFTLKHLDHYRRHPKGPEACLRLFAILHASLQETAKNEVLQAQAGEALLAFFDKLVVLLKPHELGNFRQTISHCCHQLATLDDQLLLPLVQGQHSGKRIIARLVSKCRQPATTAAATDQRSHGESGRGGPSGTTAGAATGERGQVADLSPRDSEPSKSEAGEEMRLCDLEAAARLLERLLTLNYQYWLEEEDPQPWFDSECATLCRGWQAGRLFQEISHARLREHLAEVGQIAHRDPATSLSRLLELPDHLDLVRLYKEIPDKLTGDGDGPPNDPATPQTTPQNLPAAAENTDIATTANQCDYEDPLCPDRFAENRKLLFLFRIMETKGLSLIHEETLREINRSLVQLIRRQTFEEIERFLLTTLALLKSNVRRYPHTSLQCIQVIGSEVFKRGNSRLVETFLWETVRFGFQYANVTGIGEDWQPLANPAHLANIRVWLNLIGQEPKWCSTLFSALIINLKLSGTCLKDTDLFQRDITELLNHPIEPVYNLVTQFAKLVPVFYNDIGAEGQLREVSTELDEIHQRKDLLIHFLRKQSHVESSNLIVDFQEAILLFWKDRNKQRLAPYLPEEVWRQIREEGEFVDQLHRLSQRVWKLKHIRKVEDLLNWDFTRRRAWLAEQTDIPEGERRRFDLLVRMYRLCHQKYNLGTEELRQHLKQAIDDFPEMEQLLADLEICDTFECLNALLDHLERLKEVILSEEKFVAQESIYHKRHIAVDIPSVYGRYQERKFDALSLTFRLENLANNYLEKLPDTVNLNIITKATFIRIIKCLRLYLRALKIDGISSRKLTTYMSLLSNSLGIKRFSYTQFLDIFRGLSEGVKDVIYTYYTNLHENNLSIIIPQIGEDNLLPKYRFLWQESDLSGNINRLSESFMRDLIASTFGLQHLDNFITRIYQTLEAQREVLDEEHLDLLMTYNPERAICSLHPRHHRGINLILLGNKGYNLTLLADENHPVPPGLVVTTEVFRCWPVLQEFIKSRDDFMARLRLGLNRVEQQTGRTFGDPANPLLLSVRSGAAISMPGMMATIHNLGLNEDIVGEFARQDGKEFLAWDNFRRFIQSWAMARGVERDCFQELMDAAKERCKVRYKRDFSPAQIRDLALEYQRMVRGLGIGIPEDPWLQLTGAVEMVLSSWNTPKTRDYRQIMDISDDWGTAVIVQTMVYGNIDAQAGSGVLFTAHPYRKVSRVALWGDYAVGDQGEDIVSGLVTTNPISVEQAELDGREPEDTLERRFPEVYERLLTICRQLVYEKRWNAQEIEFTFESPDPDDLYILQTRDMITIKKKESFLVFADGDRAAAEVLAHGVGVSGSALAGRAAFNEEHIRQLQQEDPEATIILIRQDTVPEDIKEIAVADGLLTARGGQTSHAAVVATRLEKTCVVGCANLKVYESEQRCEINGVEIGLGDYISIDGRKGLVLAGAHPTKKEMQILPI